MSAPTTSQETLVRSERQGHIAVLTMDRPKALNALSYSLMQQLADALEAADSDSEIRAIVLTGSERAFCAGADVSELDSVWAGHAIDRDGFARRIFDTLTTLRTPLIAAVRGLALGGGCEIALACDIVVAADTAKFGVPEVTLGLIPGGGGTQRLVHAIGKSKAMRMLLTGESITAQQASEFGIAADVVPDEDCLSAAVHLAERIARNAPLAVQLAKDAARAADDMPLPQGLAFERRNFLLVVGSDDQREGVQAFLEKRRPVFTGR